MVLNYFLVNLHRGSAKPLMWPILRGKFHVEFLKPVIRLFLQISDQKIVISQAVLCCSVTLLFVQTATMMPFIPQVIVNSETLLHQQQLRYMSCLTLEFKLYSNFGEKVPLLEHSAKKGHFHKELFSLNCNNHTEVCLLS